MKRPKLLSLRPCQFVLGMREVEAKIQKMRKMTARKLADYARAHVIPVVVGPHEDLYVIDHHHFARACWELDFGGYEVDVLKDLSDLQESKFWNEMVRRDWVYLNDQFGFGPHSPSALPVDIRCLADDPFRSLVWEVIEQGAIQKAKTPFFEFKWAAFFRLNLDVRLHSKSNFRSAVEQAVKLARSKASDHLPGFVGKKR